VFKFVVIEIRTIVRTPYIRMILFHEVRRRRNAASVLVSCRTLICDDVSCSLHSD
jgi:hypothetical protein